MGGNRFAFALLALAPTIGCAPSDERQEERYTVEQILEQVRKTETWYSPSKRGDHECNKSTPEEQKLCCDALREDIGKHNEAGRILESDGTISGALAATLEYARALDAIEAFCKNCGAHNEENRVNCD